MSRRLLIGFVFAVITVGVAQAALAQGPVYYGEFPPDYIISPTPPFVTHALSPGVYLMEPFSPPGYVFSRPFLGTPAPSDLGGYVTGSYAVGDYATRSYVRGSYLRESYVNRSLLRNSYVIMQPPR